MPKIIQPQTPIRFTWIKPDSPEIVAEAIIAASDHLGDSLPPLIASRDLVIRDVKERFDTETNPEGTMWQEWAPGYSHSGTILRRPPDKSTGPRSLYEAMTDPGSYPIAGNRLFVEQDAIYTHYGAAHQTGAGKLPSRRFVGPSGVTRGLIIDGIFGGWVNNTIAIYERGGRFYRQKRARSGRWAGTPTPVL